MANQTRRFSTSESAVQGAVQPRFGEVRIGQRGRLPHWEKIIGHYFVTFHLAGSLPKSVLERIEERHRTLEAARRERSESVAKSESPYRGVQPEKN